MCPNVPQYYSIFFERVEKEHEVILNSDKRKSFRQPKSPALHWTPTNGKSRQHSLPIIFLESLKGGAECEDQTAAVHGEDRWISGVGSMTSRDWQRRRYAPPQTHKHTDTVGWVQANSSSLLRNFIFTSHATTLKKEKENVYQVLYTLTHYRQGINLIYTWLSI